MAPKLLRIDKNGTKHWTDDICPKCGGTGAIDAYYFIDGGICFKCGGSGYFTTNWKEYTPEYAKKLEERRLARARKKAPEENAKWLRQNGFSADGKTWIVLGNTYKIKDELKAQGARFNGLLGWHMDHEPENQSAFMISTDDVCETSLAGHLFWADYCEIVDLIKELRSRHASEREQLSEYLGEVGCGLTVAARLEHVFSFETHYSYYGETNYIYKFIDAEGNILTWKTSCWLPLDEGETYEITGRVREHVEYKGDRQTQLTRCKVRALTEKGGDE